MKQALGKKLWLHTNGTPTELVISSHGHRYGDRPRTISLQQGYRPGTTVYFMVEDGVPSSQRLEQVVEGAAPRNRVHSTNSSAYLWDYVLTKMQASSGRKSDRHSPGSGSIERYQDIDDLLLRKLETINAPANFPRSKANTPEGAALYTASKRKNEILGDIAQRGPGAAGGKDLVNRGVISIRSGGRFKQQEVWLSDVIKAAQTPPYDFRVFYCLFCRVVV
jgi:hypothetical protein